MQRLGDNETSRFVKQNDTKKKKDLRTTSS